MRTLTYSRPLVWASAAILAVALPTAPVGAGSVSRVRVEYTPDTGTSVVDEDVNMIPPEQLRDVVASINGFFGLATSSAGVLGNVGMEARQTTPGGMHTEVMVQSYDEHVNPFPVPMSAEADFIIDGGRIDLLGGPIASVRYTIGINFIVKDDLGNILGNPVGVRSDGYVESRDFGPPTLATSGLDIGATLVPGLGRVEIPISFHTVNLGLIPPGGGVDILYHAEFSSDVPRAEIAAWAFSDPGQISGMGDFPTIRFSAVPEPTGIVLLGIGALGVLIYAGRMRGAGLGLGRPRGLTYGRSGPAARAAEPSR